MFLLCCHVNCCFGVLGGTCSFSGRFLGNVSGVTSSSAFCRVPLLQKQVSQGPKRKSARVAAQKGYCRKLVLLLSFRPELLSTCFVLKGVSFTLAKKKEKKKRKNVNKGLTKLCRFLCLSFCTLADSGFSRRPISYSLIAPVYLALVPGLEVPVFGSKLRVSVLGFSWRPTSWFQEVVLTRRCVTGCDRVIVLELWAPGEASAYRWPHRVYFRAECDSWALILGPCLLDPFL